MRDLAWWPQRKPISPQRAFKKKKLRQKGLIEKYFWSSLSASFGVGKRSGERLQRDFYVFWGWGMSRETKVGGREGRYPPQGCNIGEGEGGQGPQSPLSVLKKPFSRLVPSSMVFPAGNQVHKLECRVTLYCGLFVFSHSRQKTKEYRPVFLGDTNSFYWGGNYYPEREIFILIWNISTVHDL